MPARFLGREEYVEDLSRQLCAESGVVLALHGLPAVGKTALAVALAHHRDVLAHFTDGVLWARLGPTPDVMTLLDQWARELDTDVTDIDDPDVRARLVCSAMGQRRLLVVLDDVWSLDVVQWLRCSAPFCGYLLTTRDKAIAHEVQPEPPRVPVLDADPSLELVRGLAPEAWATDPEAVRTLTEAAGGLPLALELLGAYLGAPERSMFERQRKKAIEALVDPRARLELAWQRLGSAGGEPLKVAEVIELSLEGLAQDNPAGMGEAAVAAFYALGAFASKPATFDAAAAAAVAEVDESVLALLVTRNLLEMDQAEQLMLHQVVADVARQRTPVEARRRQYEYYLAVVNADRDDWRRIERLYGQMRRAKEWAKEVGEPRSLLELVYALWNYQEHHVLWAEQEVWTQEALEIAEGEEWEEDIAALNNNLGVLYQSQGRYEEAEPLLVKALQIAKQVLRENHPNTVTFRNNYQQLLTVMRSKRKRPWWRFF